MLSDFKCGICLVYPSLTEGDYFVNTHCGHIFHNECIREWICTEKKGTDTTCPTCRESIRAKDLIKLHGISPVNSGLTRKYALKFVLIGDSGTGKSSLLHVFAKGNFPTDQTSTVGCDLCFKTLDVAGKVIKLSIWDCGGQDRFLSITPNYLRNVNGVLLVYDVTNAETLDSIHKWLELVHTHAPSDISTILIGNKVDLEVKREIPSDRAKMIAEEQGFSFMETSAKDLTGVETAFRTLTAMVLENYWRSGEIDSIELSMGEYSDDLNSKKFPCC